MPAVTQLKHFAAQIATALIVGFGAWWLLHPWLYNVFYRALCDYVTGPC